MTASIPNGWFTTCSAELWDATGVEAEVGELRRQFQAASLGLGAGRPPLRLQLEYARLLVTLPARSDIREGVRLLSELVDKGHARTEALEYLALAQVKLGDYIAAKRSVDALLRLRPRDASGRLLHSLVLERAVRDGMPGAICALALSAAALVVALVVTRGGGMARRAG
mmetsp:Transcript_134138/g.347395  ORF Transcript_134138/g.347395 Transcript_134138/m.347395 type:complete len:169 (+) Transcript_134138:70-576(+)